jgi:hypothetical protein
MVGPQHNMGRYMTDERYIRTDEAEDVAGSIRHALRCAAFVSEDPQAWKWGILALHSALQGACVCHLTKTAAPLGAVTNRNAKEWINYFDENRVSQNVKCPDTKLMTLPYLLKAVRKYGSAGGSTTSNLVEISDIELVWLKCIHFEIRNQFVHFAPQGWSVEISGVPQIGRIIARIIKDINDCGWAFRHLDQTKKDVMVIDLEHLTEATWSA